eukprot:NODE_3317_length_478_cov_1140.414918_g2657_i0.p2 GENE.NODE_3317_length_478_cov_1140.414918_g2657_i0~~NODE_3317_length_478_cov_1140.414918_g2657_i0.p2  ORF type:complete len:52 (-),score=1.32 NODE_3317_length_478_cov_1140.414918_g2657_i0:169-324(-)
MQENTGTHLQRSATTDTLSVFGPSEHLRHRMRRDKDDETSPVHLKIGHTRN